MKREPVVADFIEVGVCENCGSPSIYLFEESGELISMICLADEAAVDIADQLEAAVDGALVDFESEEDSLKNMPPAGSA
jgi:hypothetical protein